MAQFDPVGQFQRGRKNALAIQQQEGQLAAQPTRNALADLQLQQAKVGAERGQTEFDQGQTQFDQGQALQRTTIINQSMKALRGLPEGQRAQAMESLKPKLQEFGIDLSQLPGDALTDQVLDNGIASTQGFISDPTSMPQVSDLDKARAEKLRAETGKIQSETGAPSPDQASPIAPLIQDLSPELQVKAQSVFDASGGGDKGVKAALKVIDTGTEAEKFQAAPLKLQTSYPNATPEEMTQLENVMKTAKTAESGFKEVDKLREKQRQVKKGKVFQQRAVDLLDRILGADELNDVIGSIEGSDESLIPFGGQKLRGDNESEIIADIEEAGNILTADNLDIMSGVLSETDIKIIANLAGGALNRKRGEAAFIRDVTNLRAKMAGELGLEEQADLQSKTDAELLSF